MVDLSSLADLGTTPISDESPAGENARYEESFDELQAEVGKLESLEGGEVDWNKVAEVSVGILRNQSKDLLVAAYLGAGLWEQDRYAGLVAATQTLRDILANHWEGCFPNRIRARRTALNWLLERMAGWLDAGTVELARPEAEALVANLDAMYSSTEDKWEDQDPAIWQTLKRFKEHLESLPEPLPEAPEPAVDEMPAPTIPGAAAPVAVASTGPALDASGPIASRAEAFRRLEEIADFLAKTEPHSPIVPLIRRVVHWSTLDFHELYGQLLGRFPDGMSYVWDVLGLDAEGTPAEDVTPPAKSAASTPAPAPTQPAPAPTPAPAPEPAAADAGGEDEMPAPTFL